MSNRKDYLLVVDDNEMNRDLLSRRLSRAGYEVRVAENGQQALNLLVDHDIDLVLLDILMPVLDGMTVLKLIRKTYTMSDLPVIMVTAKEGTEDIVTALEIGANDYVAKPINFPVVLARVRSQLSAKKANDAIKALADELEQKNRFIRRTFGRYVSSEVVDNLLERPEGLRLSGEHRQVSILMADMRGFTALAEILSPEQTVTILNHFVGAMTGIIAQHNGTVSEIIGDGILSFFGAPVTDDKHAQNAVACAIQMQLAMQAVNEKNRLAGLPDVQIGIGVNSGAGIVGNIGSEHRSKYAVVGSVINMAARLESYSTGGQILISETTLEEVGAVVRIAAQRVVHPKGSDQPLTLYEVNGIGGDHRLFLDAPGQQELYPLARAIPVSCRILEGKKVSEQLCEGQLLKLSRNAGQFHAPMRFAPLSDLKIELLGDDGQTIPGALYGKVLENTQHDEDDFFVRFTSVSPELGEAISVLLESARTPRS